MVFIPREEADPLLQQISFLLSPISGIESRLNTAIDGLGKVTLDAASFQAQQIFAAFEQLTEVLESQAKTRVDEASNIIDAIIQTARIDFGTVTDRIDITAEDARIEAVRQAELTRREIASAAASTSAAAATQVEETNKALDLIGEVTSAAIRALPGGIGEGLAPIFESLKESFEDRDTALGGGFSFLGASNLIGFSQIGDILQNIFNIDPADFQAAFEGIAKAMVDMSEVAGNAILEVEE